MIKQKNFIIGSLNKKKTLFCLTIEAFLDIIYYFIPFSFTFLLTMPFTLEKASLVAGIFITSKLLRTFGNYFERHVMDNYLYEYGNTLYYKYYEKLLKLPVPSLLNYQTGYLENVIQKIVVIVQKLLTVEYIGVIISFSTFFYTVFNQSKGLFIIAFLDSILCIYLSVRILKKANNTVEKLYETENEYFSIYQDYISNIRTVKSINNNAYFLDKIKKVGTKTYKANSKYVKCYSKEEIIRNFLILLPFALAIIKAVIDLSYGMDTLGIITFYISIFIEMGFIFDQVSSTIISGFELKALNKKVRVLFKNQDSRKQTASFKTIKLQDVNIHYKDVLFSIKVPNLIITKNDRICIMGKSGQGKTTILNLLLGNIEDYSGVLTIDNISFNNTKLDIGLISQEIELFNMSIKDNICLGVKIKHEELINYLKELDLEDILLFENGLDTIVGEKGLKLSTGQKRRINLLRSYLQNKEIYILDEPTSNLDKETEAIVVDFILKYFRDKTLIIATHNEEIRKACNQFYIIENHTLSQENKIK